MDKWGLWEANLGQDAICDLTCYKLLVPSVALLSDYSGDFLEMNVVQLQL